MRSLLEGEVPRRIRGFSTHPLVALCFELSCEAVLGIETSFKVRHGLCEFLMSEALPMSFFGIVSSVPGSGSIHPSRTPPSPTSARELLYGILK